MNRLSVKLTRLSQVWARLGQARLTKLWEQAGRLQTRIAGM